MKKIFVLTCALLCGAHALNAMDNQQIPLDKLKITDIESQTQKPVSYSQIIKAIEKNNTENAIQLFKKAQSQKDAQAITQEIGYFIALIDEGKKGNEYCALLGTIGLYSLGALSIGLGIWFATKISSTTYYELAVFACFIAAFMTITPGLYAHGNYDFIKLAQRCSPEIIKAVTLELKKIDLINKKKQLEEDKKTIEQQETELEKLVNTATAGE